MTRLDLTSFVLLSPSLVMIRHISFSFFFFYLHSLSPSPSPDLALQHGPSHGTLNAMRACIASRRLALRGVPQGQAGREEGGREREKKKQKMEGSSKWERGKVKGKEEEDQRQDE